MAHHYAFMMKVAAEQELESPSLRPRLEGEEWNYRGKVEPRKAAQRPKKAKVAQMPTKPKKSKPDVGLLTLELEGAC